jgi:hypothetical protein
MNKVELKSIGVLSAGKVQGVLGAVIGLILGILYGGIILVFSLIGAGIGGKGGLVAGGGGIIAAIAVVIIFPIMYGLIMFIAGMVSALIYNLCAGMIGGIEMEFESIGGQQTSFRG